MASSRLDDLARGRAINVLLGRLSSLARYVAMTIVAALLVSVLLTFAQKSADAQPIDLTIAPTSLSSAPGGTVNFMGTITNMTGVTLNATDLFFNFSGFNPSVVTPSQLLGTPDFVLPDTTTSGVVDLFNVTIAPTAIPGNTYPLDALLQDINNNLSNSVTVDVTTSGPPPVPEPNSLVLFMVGIASMGGVAYARGYLLLMSTRKKVQKRRLQ